MCILTAISMSCLTPAVSKLILSHHSGMQEEALTPIIVGIWTEAMKAPVQQVRCKPPSSQNLQTFVVAATHMHADESSHHRLNL